MSYNSKLIKVFVSLNIPDIGIELLKKEGFEVEVWTVDKPISPTELIDNAKKSNALLCSFSDKIDKEFLSECKHLNVISQFAVGYNNIDIPLATKLNIPIGYTPDILNDATADIAFMLMLAASRKLFHAHKKIAKGEWGYFKPKGDLGIELKNKTLGIYGLGRIGLEMAKRCKGAYNMNVLYYNRTRNKEAEKMVGAKLVIFDELLQQSDVVSVHCSLNEETAGVFNKEAFRKMKRTAIFVNTSRGTVHNEADLIKALNNGEIWGAGLDVTNPEPMHPDNPLLSMENVAVSPHIGSASVEARDGMSKIAAENIIQHYRGEKITNIVNPEIYKKN